MSVLLRWCSILERHRSPDAPEVLRMACAEALCVAGVPLMSHSLNKHSALPEVMIRYTESETVYQVITLLGTEVQNVESFWL